MSEPDFSGIDPLRVPEARRRVAAIEQYLSLEDPTGADTRRYAQPIGLSRVQFQRLARVWRDHRDARLLVIGKRGASKRDYGVDQRAIEIANDVIAQMGANTIIRVVAAEIERRCADAHIAPPSRASIYVYLRAARAAAGGPAEGPPRLVIGRMWFHLPVEGADARAMPTLLCAVALPERIIVAHETSLDPMRPPSVDALIEKVAALQSDGAPARPLMLDPDDRRSGASALACAGLDSTRSAKLSVQRELSKAFAGRLGPLNAIYQRSMARPANKRATRQEMPLAADHAIDVIEGAIDTHNAARLCARPDFKLEPFRD